MNLFVFIAFECFYSAGVRDLMIKTIRKFTYEEFLAAKRARGKALKAFKSVDLCLFSFYSIHVGNFSYCIYSGLNCSVSAPPSGSWMKKASKGWRT